jgi:hypothetical protein
VIRDGVRHQDTRTPLVVASGVFFAPGLVAGVARNPRPVSSPKPPLFFGPFRKCLFYGSKVV